MTCWNSGAQRSQNAPSVNFDKTELFALAPLPTVVLAFLVARVPSIVPGSRQRQ